MKILLAALLLLPLSAHAQVYRCDIVGQAHYQSRPCDENSTRILQDNLTTYQAPPAHQQQRSPAPRAQRQPQYRELPPNPSNAPTLRHLDRTQLHIRIAHARSQGYLALGMPESQTISILGHPDNSQLQRFSDKTCRVLSWDNAHSSRGRHQAMICDGIVVRYRRS